MSEALEHQQAPGGEPVTEDDLRRMLADMRTQNETLTKERDTERSGRMTALERAEAERAARLTTEVERDGHAARITTDGEQLWTARRDAVKASIAVQESAVSAAEEAYARNAEAGDHAAAAKAQRQMAEAAAKLVNLQSQSEYLETNKEKLIPAAPVQRREAAVQQPTGDRYSQFISGRIEASEREWLDAHPKFMEDPRYRAEVFAASTLSTARGNARGTQAYIREMNKILGEDAQEPTRETPRQQDRSLSSDLAPQRRAAPGQQPAGGTEKRLSAEEAEVADGFYGNPNSDDYIPEQAKRYEHYWDMRERRRQAGRM